MIRLDNVSKVYKRGARPALDEVTLDIDRGEFVFLVGASGSGKSTFLRLVLREERATTGTVYGLGHDLARISRFRMPRHRRQIGMVFQDYRLLPGKSVFDNVAITMQVTGRPRHQILTVVPQTLELVGLTGKEKRLPHELSGGEQQRVTIARAMVNRPQVLLADEPTGNLDPDTSGGIMELLTRINSTGTTVVMATHDEHLVDRARRRVVELVDGRVVRDEAGGAYLAVVAAARRAAGTSDDDAPVAGAPDGDPPVATSPTDPGDGVGQDDDRVGTGRGSGRGEDGAAS